MKIKITKRLNSKFIIYCSIFAVILCVVLGSISFVSYRNDMYDRYYEYVRTLLNVSNEFFDGDDIKQCIEKGKSSIKLEEGIERLNSVKMKSENNYFYMSYFPDKSNKTKMKYVLYANTEKDRQNGFKDSKVNQDCKDTDFEASAVKAFYQAQFGEKQTEAKFVVNNTALGLCLTGYIPINDSKGNCVAVFGIDMFMNIITDHMISYVITIALSGLALLAVYLMLYLWVMRKVIINPILSLERSANDFVRQTNEVDEPEELNFKSVPVHSGNEIEMLSHGLDAMTSQVKEYMVGLKKVTAEKERIGAELNVATQIQADMLPRIFPPFPEKKEFDLFASMDPAKEVGGDFYDFFMVDDDHVAVVIGDVSGKGVPAALFMVISKTIIKNYSLLGLPPDEVFNRANNELCEGNDAGLFTTAWLGIYEISTGKMVYADAGHDDPIRRKVDGTMEFIHPKKKKLVLAGFENMKYILNEFTLEPGELLLLYTDGVPEATNAENELYGLDRLEKSMIAHKDDRPHELLPHLREDVDEFVADAPQFDDLTMLAIEIHVTKS